MHEVDWRDGGRRGEGGRSGAWSQGSGHTEMPQSPAARQEVLIQECSRAGSKQSRLSNLPIIKTSRLKKQKNLCLMGNFSAFIPLASTMKDCFFVFHFKKWLDAFFLYEGVKHFVKMHEVAITFFLSCFWDYEISSFFELWTVKMWLQILTSANSSKKQGSILKWDMCLFMGKGQKKFPPHFKDIFPSQDFKHCLFVFFSLFGLHGGWFSFWLLVGLCPPVTMQRLLCMFGLLELDVHAEVADRCVSAASWLISCSHPHTSTIQSLLHPRGILRSPTHRRHYHPHILLLLLLLYHLISAGRRERRQDTRF